MECCNCGSDKHVSYSKHCKYIKEEWNRRNKTYTDILEAANQPNNKKSKMLIARGWLGVPASASEATASFTIFRSILRSSTFLVMILLTLLSKTPSLVGDI